MCAPMSVDWCDAAIYSVYHKPKLQNIFLADFKNQILRILQKLVLYLIIQQGRILHDEGRRDLR